MISANGAVGASVFRPRRRQPHPLSSMGSSELPEPLGAAPPDPAPPPPAPLALHTPPRQVPSGQVVPSGFTGSEQTPSAGSHVPASWHSSRGAHVRGSEPMHAPAS